MNFKNKRNAVLKARAKASARNRRHTPPPGAPGQAPADGAPDGVPETAERIPAIGQRTGRNRYACATAGCPAQLTLSNGVSKTCRKCGRHHRLQNPHLAHWQDQDTAGRNGFPGSVSEALALGVLPRYR